MNVTEHRNSFVRVVVCDTLRVDSFAAYVYSKNATTRFFASRFITSQTLLATKKHLGIPLRYQSFSPVSLREAQ